MLPSQCGHDSRFEKTSGWEKLIFPMILRLSLAQTPSLRASLTLPEPIRARDMVGESSLWAGTVR